MLTGAPCSSGIQAQRSLSDQYEPPGLPQSPIDLANNVGLRSAFKTEYPDVLSNELS